MAIFSSPEHNMRKGAFGVVLCPLCVINNFFKHPFLPNYWAYLYQIWQECSLGGPLEKLFTEFDSVLNSGCHGKQIDFFCNSLKIFFSGIPGQILKYFTGMFLG